MERKRAQGLPDLRRISPAANEDFVAPLDRPERLARPQPSWDPYEVWRTRVKMPAIATPERERDPLR